VSIDHGCDEEFIWAFGKTPYNQQVILNQYLNPGGKAHLYTHAPIWGRKLAMPHYYKREKLEKFYRHWNHRLGLESLKAKHARLYGSLPSEKEREVMRLELIQYIESCYEFEELKKMEDVYVTDHKPIPRKYLTNSDQEDEDFFEYQQSLEAYNSDGAAPNKIFGSSKPEYARGSVLQRALDPFFGSGRDELGTIVVNIDDRDLASYRLNDVERVKAEFDALRDKTQPWELNDDEATARMQLLKELTEKNPGYDLNEWKDIIAQELGVFNNENYNFTKDLKQAYRRSLKTSTEDKILETIPDHYFWDIKTPQGPTPVVRKNRYNPFRGREFDSYFEMRESERYLQRMHNKKNHNDAISIYHTY
jgi:hypothetical protein